MRLTLSEDQSTRDMTSWNLYLSFFDSPSPLDLTFLDYFLENGALSPCTHKQKREVKSLFVSFSVALLKQQVMIDVVCHWSRSHASCLIGVETPAIPCVFLNRFTDILMVLNFYAYPFFQSNQPSSTLEQALPIKIA